MLECDWPNTGLNHPFKVVRNRAFTLRNNREEIAFNVHIQDVLIGDFVAHFDVAPKLEKGKPVYALLAISALEGKSKQPGTTDFELLLTDTYFERLDNQEQLMQIIPLRVTFNDIHGNLYETSHELHYDGWTESGEIHFKNFRKVE